MNNINKCKKQALPEGVHIIHYRRKDARGNRLPQCGMTTAYTAGSPGTFRYAQAFCHVKDNFNRYIGRVKAVGRLDSAKLYVVYEGTEEQLLNHLDAQAEMIGLSR